MIYICTVHHKTIKWIEPQMRYLKKYLKSDYRIFSDTPDGKNYKNEFYYVQHVKSGRKGTTDHVAKLKKLSRAVLLEASPSDVLIFLDGDAFPIAPLDSYLETALQEYPLIAVQRKEHGGAWRLSIDAQRKENTDCFAPHPSFCCTTVGFWKFLKTTWKQGRDWRDSGGKLLAKLESLGIQWKALNRTNNHSLHELWFGVYGDLIYHHGAGFRAPVSVPDLIKAGYPPKHRQCSVRKFSRTPKFRENVKMSEQVYQMLLEDDDFYKKLT